jgi:gas vesicle protein
MDASGLHISLSLVIAIVSGVVSAVGVWFKLKGKVELQQLKIETMEDGLEIAQERVSKLKTQVEANKEKNETAVADLKQEMNNMEMRIIKAIHELTTQINKK